jgi:hypothetical protein
MVNYINTLPKTKVYDGAKNMYNHEYYFITGHNVLMSRDTVEILVKHKNEYLALPYPEDLATGRLLIHDLEFTNFSEQTSNDTFTVVDPNNLTLSPVPATYLYRTRHTHSEVFYDLHKMING